jgi:anti-sigma factor RsiW
MQADDPQFDESLLSAYLDDELTSQERELVEQKLADSPTLQKLLAELSSVRALVRHLHANSPERSFSRGPWNSAELTDSSSTIDQDTAKTTTTVQLPKTTSESPIQWQRLASLAALLLVTLGIGGLLLSNFVRDSGATIGFTPELDSTRTAPGRSVAPSVAPTLNGPNGDTVYPGEAASNAPPAGSNLKSMPPAATSEAGDAPSPTTQELWLESKEQSEAAPAADKQERLNIKRFSDPAKAKIQTKQMGSDGEDSVDQATEGPILNSMAPKPMDPKSLKQDASQLGAKLAMELPSATAQDNRLDSVRLEEQAPPLLSDEFSMALSKLLSESEASKRFELQLQEKTIQQRPEETSAAIGTLEQSWSRSDYYLRFGDTQTWKVSPGIGANTYEFRLNETVASSDLLSLKKSLPDSHIVLEKRESNPLQNSDQERTRLAPEKPGEPKTASDEAASLPYIILSPKEVSPSANTNDEYVVDFLIPRSQWADGSLLLQKIGIPVQFEPPATSLEFFFQNELPEVSQDSKVQAQQEKAHDALSTDTIAVAGQAAINSADTPPAKRATEDKDEPADIIRIRIRILPKK